MRNRSTIASILALCCTLLLVSGPADARGRDVPGSYVAQLDLGPLGEPRIETLYVILDNNGSLLFTSEHEADKESPGVGFWRHHGAGEIGMGAASFRYGPNPDDSICALVAVDSPPGNCVLKIGGTMSRQAGGGFAGEVFLTVETVDGGTVLTLPPALPMTLRQLTLGDFPGALP